VDQGPRRVVQPVTIGLGIACGPWLPAIDLLRQSLEAEVPVGEVTQHACHRPVLVHGRAKRLVVQALDKRAQSLPLTCVRFDVRPIVIHGLDHIADRENAHGQGTTHYGGKRSRISPALNQRARR
jgi:hypothetical protein